MSQSYEDWRWRATRQQAGALLLDHMCRCPTKQCSLAKLFEGLEACCPKGRQLWAEVQVIDAEQRLGGTT